MNETTMQAIVMQFAMETRHHNATLPNATLVYPWEVDVLSITRGLFTHEFEIKVTAADYRADFRKKEKHYRLRENRTYQGRSLTPNYFWYVTWDILITDLPPYAGWIQVTSNNRFGGYDLLIAREAPRLHQIAADHLFQNETFSAKSFLGFAVWPQK